MRAKQLEVLKIKKNPAVGARISQVLYNLAFSPQIRYIDISHIPAENATTAESIFKLISISGAIEYLNISYTGLRRYLTSDFYKALGESKTLKYLNISEKADKSFTSQ